MEVKFDKHSLIVDGKRTFIRSGAYHYFRTPGMEQDRFLKMKSAGYNCVDIYFHWGYHSKKQGEYDFSGIKDVRKILQAAKVAGLFVIARPGPFINAEVSAGGLPLWVLENKNIVPRNRIGTQHKYSKEYMDCIKEWYDNIIPIICEFDNIILFQIENEYATDEMDEVYMRELYQMARERGITCPIIHNDAYTAGLWNNIVDIYGCDLYPYINPKQDWKKDNYCFDTIDNLEDMCRSFKEDSPICIVELQSGWFDKWDGSGYKHIRQAFGDEFINIMTKTALSQGVTIFNHYMACGGTSWGDLACDEVYTSYEFAAPVDEYGALHKSYFKAKEINYFLNSFGLTNTEPLSYDVSIPNIYTKLRKDNENNCEWLFIRNFNNETKNIELTQNRLVSIKPFDMKICAINLELYGCKINFSDAEIFTRLKDENNDVIFFIVDENSFINVDDNISISCDKKDFERCKFEKNGRTTEFVFLSKALADKTWVIDNKIIFNADIVLQNNIIGLKNTSEISYFDLKHGFSKKAYKTDKKEKELELKPRSAVFCANEIDCEYDYSNWQKVESATDTLSCKIYDEFVWYKAVIPDTINELTLSARHLFAVYINGKEVLSRNSYKLENLQEIPETIQIPLNKVILTKQQNELTILVENLGFDKGFSGDTNNPRGLVTFSTEPQTDIQFYIQGKLSCQKGAKKESLSPYLLKISADFDIDFKNNHIFSKYLYLKNFPYRRATIFLNGVKIGRYIKRANVQDRFYLLSGFLKEHNTIDIVIWQREKNITSIWDFKNEAKNVILEIGDEYNYQLFN